MIGTRGKESLKDGGGKREKVMGKRRRGRGGGDAEDNKSMFLERGGDWKQM